MLSSILPAPDIPEWLSIIAGVLYVCLLFGLFGWALVLEYRYISPYTLINTSNRDKWRRAAVLSLLYTSIIPIFGFVAPVISPLSDQWLFIPICGGIWIAILPIATLYKRWEFERHIKNHQRLDKMIKDKNGVYQRPFSNPFTSWTRVFMTAEQKRFFSEGFPENLDEKKDGESSSQN